MAAFGGHEAVAVVGRLLAAGAAMDTVCFGKTPLAAAEENGHTAVAALLRNPPSQRAAPAPLE